MWNSQRKPPNTAHIDTINPAYHSGRSGLFTSNNSQICSINLIIFGSCNKSVFWFGTLITIFISINIRFTILCCSFSMKSNNIYYIMFRYSLSLTINLFMYSINLFWHNHIKVFVLSYKRNIDNFNHNQTSNTIIKRGSKNSSVNGISKNIMTVSSNILNDTNT